MMFHCQGEFIVLLNFVPIKTKSLIQQPVQCGGKHLYCTETFRGLQPIKNIIIFYIQLVLFQCISMRIQLQLNQAPNQSKAACRKHLATRIGKNTQESVIGLPGHSQKYISWIYFSSLHFLLNPVEAGYERQLVKNANTHKMQMLSSVS